MRHKNRFALLAISPLALLVSTHAALAQSINETVELEEIIVTATRQSQSIIKVPVSVSALSSEAMDSRGIRDFSDIVRQTPGVTIERSNTTSNISVRGVNSAVGAATTGIYIDDIPIQIRQLGYGGGNAYPVVFDLERVEVLRGPQGTLFGAGSMGGTVRFITQQPSFSGLKVYSRGELSSTQHGSANGELGLSLTGPVVDDKLALAASAYYRRDGGFVDRISSFTGKVVDENANRTDSYVGRLAASWRASDRVKITPSFYYQDLKTNDSPETWERYSNYGDSVFRNANQVQESGRDKFYLPAVNVSVDFDGVELIAVGSYFDRRQEFVQDYTTFDQTLFTGVNHLPYLPEQQAPANFVVAQKNWTGEVRLQSDEPTGHWQWVVGGFFAHAEQTSIQQVVDPYLPVYLFGQRRPVPGYSVYDQNAVSTDEQVAAFGQLTYNITDQLSAIAGLRYSHTKFKIQDIAQGFVVGPLVDDRGRQSENPITPKVGLNYQATPDTLLYASASRGFRVGGYNPQVGTQCGAELNSIGYPNGRPTNYDSDSVWSKELGVKSRFAGLGSIQASVYQIDWKNIQQAVGLNSCGFQFTSNLGKARSRGFDVQVEVRPVEGLSLQAEVGYTDAQFLETVRGGPTAAAPLVSSGDRVQGAPWTVSLHGQYDFDVTSTLPAYVRTDFDYRSKQTKLPPYLNPANGAIDTDLTLPPAMSVWSARIGARPGDFDVSVFVNNILDKSTWTRRERASNPNEFFRREVIRPRTFGVTVGYRY
ncbi:MULTISPECIES: TonB-dependent receptor [Niveispirillum]|uniref:Ligand-gated channel protein n=2 Tax=Niveispirillum TaxID=1543704 RepID=A0A255Z6N3_9PROT|nr:MULTISPECIES: TonB-dependent receptor [Niveispirillum]AUN31035.1 TonB-dependent receptor [Niveispirillum cyanobacteriorum]OYQ37081.1 ligand-gated channel protein [Niveispirillum lacus]GGE88052.1 TonB-dependent receptor [Niveispirillum cyanobacteriorum]